MAYRRESSGRVSYVHDDEENDRQLELEIDYVIYPSEPAVMYTRNGDGYPGSPAVCEFHNVRIDHLNFADGDRAPTEQEAKELAGWFMNLLESDQDLYDRVAVACSEDAAAEHESAMEAAADAAYERRRCQ